MWYHLHKRTIAQNSNQYTMQDKPLQGVRVLVTRAEEQADSFADLLQERGATTIERALLAVGPASDYSELDKAINQLAQYQWIIFASQNAVKFTLQRLKALGLPAQALSQCQLASIGPATSNCLAEEGLSVAFQPTAYVAETLVAEFQQQVNLAGQRLLWPKTNIGRLLIADGLRAAGAQVDTAIAYESGLPTNKEHLGRELVALLRDQAIDIITLASAQTARNLGQLLDLGLQLELGPDHKEKLALLKEEKEELLSSVKIAAIGPITAAAAEQSLGRVDLIAEEHTLKGLTDSLLASLKFEQNQI
jgi:uroporphyrinogen III methyltransferase/synthase